MLRISSVISAALLGASLCALAAAAGVAWAQDTRKGTFEGFDLKDGRPLFRGEITIRNLENRLFETVVYTDLNGREIQRMEAEYDRDSLALIKYRREHKDNGEWEAMERSGNRVRMTHQASGEAKPKTKELEWEEGMTFSVVVGSRIRKERESLRAGKEVAFPLIVPSRLDVYSFRVRQDKPATVAGQPAWVARMEPDAFLIRQLVDPMFFYYGEDGLSDLLEYRGRTTVHGEKGKALDARIVYHYGNPG